MWRYLSRSSEGTGWMSRKGQCPACFETHSIDDDQLASVLRCGCGASLFVCNATGFQEIPVHCRQCGESYLVEPEDIGHSVECECGAEIEVFDTVLRPAIKRDDATLQADEAESSRSEFDAEESASVISCPQCSSEYEVSLEDVGEIAECDCGLMFVVRNGDQGLIAVAEEGRADALPSQSETSPVFVVEEPPAEKKAKSSSASKSKRGKSTWPLTLGISAVVAFFLFAVGMFYFSRSGGDEASAEKVAQPASENRPQQVAGPTTIKPGLLDQLLAAVPVPVSESVSSDSAAGMGDVLITSPGSSSTGAVAQSRSPFGARTLPRDLQLPSTAQPRPRVPIVPVRRPRLVFQSAYQEAFESYEELSAMMVGDQPKPEGYDVKLGETIALTKNAYKLAIEVEDVERRNELCYLLAYLSHTAGHLMEAAIYGEAAARWGDKSQPATHEAAMIALAATQEANATGWAAAEQVGELAQMEAIADLIQQRWPDDPQLDAIWLNLAQSYAAFGRPLLAAKAWLRLKPKSPEYPAALLAAGGAYWSHFLNEASVESPDPEQMVDILKTAEKYLGKAVKLIGKDESEPMMNLLSAKLTLVKISGRLGDWDAVLERLTEQPFPLVDSIGVADDSQSPGKLKVDDSFARSVFDHLYRARLAQGDLVGASDALDRLAQALGSENRDEVGRKRLQIATRQIERLRSQPSVTQDDVTTLERFLTSLDAHQAILSLPNRLWIAESWATLAEHADGDELAIACYAKAASGYADAMAQSDFPAASTQSAMLRRADLLRRSGSNRQSLEIIADVLEQTPNVIDLQMLACQSLQQLAFDENAIEPLRAAIDGSAEDSEIGGTSIWGWAELATSLHQLRYSEQGTPRHAAQLLEAQFHLARCQWLLANVTDDPGERTELLAKASRQVSRLLATTPADDESTAAWRAAFERLMEELEAS